MIAWNPYRAPSPRVRRMLGACSILLVLLLWAVLTETGWVSPAKLPSPMRTWKALLYLSWDAEREKSLLLEATIASVSRVLVAGVLVALVGLPLGVAMGASPRLNALLSPLIDPFRSAPVVALLPIMVMWLGIGEGMKVAFLFLGAVVFLIPMVRDAIQAVPRSYWISARDLGASPGEATWQAVLPLAKPRIADALIVAVSVMWTYITVAEYVNAQTGVGQLIQNARRFSAMDQVFVGIFIIIALALVTYQLMVVVKRKLFPWEAEL